MSTTAQINTELDDKIKNSPSTKIRGAVLNSIMKMITGSYYNKDTDYIKFKGVHRTDRTYAKDEIAIYQNVLYVCLIDNTTGAFDATKWISYLDRNPGVAFGFSVYSAATAYLTGNYVEYSNLIFRAKADVTGVAPDVTMETASWVQVPHKHKQGDPWRAGLYLVDALVIKDDKLYRADVPDWFYSNDFESSLAAEDWVEVSGKYSKADFDEDVDETLDNTALVNLTIAVTWVLKMTDGLTDYTLKSGNLNSKTITVDKGVLAAYTATFSYPAAGAGEALPTATSGNFGTTLPGAGNNSDELTDSSLEENTTVSQIITKPKSGLILSGGQVVRASGVDSDSDSITINFADWIYFGLTTESDVNNMDEADVQAGATQRFGDQSETFTGVTDGSGNYVFFAYPATSPDLSSIILDGASPILGAFTKASSNLNVTNDAGAVIPLKVYKANAPNSYSGNSLAFS